MMQSTTIQNGLEYGMHLRYLPPHSFQKQYHPSLRALCDYISEQRDYLYIPRRKSGWMNDLHYLCSEKAKTRITSSDQKLTTFHSHPVSTGVSHLVAVSSQCLCRLPPPAGNGGKVGSTELFFQKTPGRHEH